MLTSESKKQRQKVNIHYYIHMYALMIFFTQSCNLGRNKMAIDAYVTVPNLSMYSMRPTLSKDWESHNFEKNHICT